MNEEINERLRIIDHEKNKIRQKILEYECKLERKIFEESLLNISLSGPLMIPATNKFNEYTHLTEMVKIPSCNLTIYPVWIELEAIYPGWSKNIKNLYIQSIRNYESSDIEIIYDAIVRSTGCSYKYVIENFKNINCEPVYPSDINVDNINIDFDQSQIISSNSTHLKKKKFLCYTELLDTYDLHLSIIEMKYLLIVPNT